ERAESEAQQRRERAVRERREQWEAEYERVESEAEAVPRKGLEDVRAQAAGGPRGVLPGSAPTRRPAGGSSPSCASGGRRTTRKRSANGGSGVSPSSRPGGGAGGERGGKPLKRRAGGGLKRPTRCDVAGSPSTSAPRFKPGSGRRTRP